MEERMNIYQKLAKIRKPVEIIKKNKKGYGYTYATEDLILSKITGLMGKYGVSLIPCIIHNSMATNPINYLKTKVTKSGEPYEEHVNEVLVTADMEWTWVNDENPEEKIVVPWALVGCQSDASQSFGSALTYSSRYFLLKYFNAATSDDDPDEYRRRQKESEEEEDKVIAKGIVDQIHVMVTKHLESNPDDRQKVTDIIKKLVKDKGKASSNYFTITSSDVAMKLMEALKSEFDSEGTDKKTVVKKENKEDKQ